MKKLVFIFCVVAVTSVQAQLDKMMKNSFETTRTASEPIALDAKEAYVIEVSNDGSYTKYQNPDGSTTVQYADGVSATYSSTGETLYKTDSSGTIYYADGTTSNSLEAAKIESATKYQNADGTTTVKYPEGTSATYSPKGEILYKTDTEGNVYYADGTSSLDSTAVKLTYEESKLDAATAVSYDGAVKEDSFTAISDAEVVSASTRPTLSSTTTSYAEPVRDSAVIGTTTAVNDGQIATAYSDGEVAVGSGASSTSVSSSSVTEVKDSAVIGITTAVNDGQIATAISDGEVLATSGTTSGTTSVSSGTSTTLYDSLVPTSWSDPVTSSSFQPVSIDLDGETSSYLCSRYNKCATTSTSTSTTTSGSGGGGRLSLNKSNYSINAGLGLVAATDSATFSKAAVGIFQQVAWTGSGSPVAWSGGAATSLDLLGDAPVD